MNRNRLKQISHNYLSLLEAGDIEELLRLFAKNAIVHSPIYGSKSARDFYTTLNADTRASKLLLDGIFIEEEQQRLILLFDYHWTVRDGNEVSFKVADVLEFNAALKITKLSIIYDTVVSRSLIAALDSE